MTNEEMYRIQLEATAWQEKYSAKLREILAMDWQGKHSALTMEVARIQVSQDLLLTEERANFPRSLDAAAGRLYLNDPKFNALVCAQVDFIVALLREARR